MLTAFRIIAFFEGLSYVLLIFVGVPLKYINGDVTIVKTLGMPHGFLFMAYIAFAIVIRLDHSWFKKHFILISQMIFIGANFWYISNAFYYLIK